MNVKFTNSGNTLIAELIGELDHHGAEYLRQKLDIEIFNSSVKNLIFDFSKVSFMDSSGIGVLMGRYKNIIKFNGKVCMINLNDHVKRVFEMSGIYKYVPVYENIATALALI